jgi:hypothetical protein
MLRMESEASSRYRFSISLPVPNTIHWSVQTENIATDNWNEVTCRKCLALIYKMKKR